MKTTRLLKMLSLLGFLLLFAPFYDSCNGKGMFDVASENPVEEFQSIVENKNSLAVKEIDSNKLINDKPNSYKSSENVEEVEIPFYQKIYDFIDDGASQNAIEFASFNDVYFHSSFAKFTNSIKREINKNDYQGFFFGLKNFCFLLIVIISILNFIFSFKNIKLMYKLSLLNLTLLSITIICLFLEGFLETISQIKWGYYTFIIVNFLVLFISKKAK